ncbi:hypothetical protein PR048_008425 [Dryococelus australis]|uniref:Uncharacterized protein n=1 Tax=Dryococelus australis TaxID=614101 RepID=A0ABQ9HX29_9NEOP|nr:hypothetical protein PR048_008425 [Dryococelus australis]
MKGREKREIPEKTRRPICENQVTRLGIQGAEEEWCVGPLASCFTRKLVLTSSGRWELRCDPLISTELWAGSGAAWRGVGNGRGLEGGRDIWNLVAALRGFLCATPAAGCCVWTTQLVPWPLVSVLTHLSPALSSARIVSSPHPGGTSPSRYLSLLRRSPSMCLPHRDTRNRTSPGKDKSPPPTSLRPGDTRSSSVAIVKIIRDRGDSGSITSGVSQTRVSAQVKRGSRCWPAGFLRDLPFSPPLLSLTVPSPRFTPSALRPQPVIEVSMEQRRNEREGETGDHQENPPTNCIVWHDSHMRKSGVTRPGIEPGSPWGGGAAG